jgi:hypothetical protein
MGWQDAPTKNAWENAPVAEETPKNYTIGESLTSAGKKAVPGIGKFTVDAVNALIHPINTVNTLADLGAGAIYKGLPQSFQQQLDKADIALIGPEKAKETKEQALNLANAVGKEYSQYGSFEGFKRRLAEHPEAVMADISTVLSGGAGLATKGSQLGKMLATSAKYTNPLKPAEMAVGATVSGAGKLADKLNIDTSNIASNVAGSLSNVNPEAYRTVYEAYKRNDPEILDKLKNGTAQEKQLYSDMIYNYSRKLGLPHEEALTPLDYTRNHPQGMGAWDVWDRYAAGFPELKASDIRARQYRPFEDLSREEQLSQATQAGVDTGRLSLIPPGKKDFGDILKIGAKLVAPSLLHNPLVTALESPRITRAGFAAAGKAANLAEKIPPIPLSVDQANKIGLMLYQMNQNKEQQ